MKTLMDIFLFFFAFISWVIIGMSGQMLRDISVEFKDSIAYVVTLFLSLGYAQWYLHRFLSPLQRVNKDDRIRLKKRTFNKYKKGFFVGSIGLGYLLALIYAMDLLSPDSSTNTNFAKGAIFFILVGTIAQARELTAMLVDEFIVNKNNIEQSAPVDAKKPAPLS